MFLRFIYVVARFSTSCLLMTNIDLPYVFIYSSVSDGLGCFSFLALMNNASINVCVQVFYEHTFCNSLQYIPRTTAGPYDDSELSFLRNGQTVFRGHHFAFPPVTYENSACSTSLSTLGIFRLLNRNHSSTGCVRYFIVVFIFISLVSPKNISPCD